MVTRRRAPLSLWVLSLGIAALLGGQAADAATYPTNKCVSSKQKEAGKYCKSVLKAWAVWDKKGGASTSNDAKRDEQIARADTKLALKWGKADDKASKKATECPTLASSEAASLVQDAVADMVATINAGLDLGQSADRNCGSKLLKTTSIACDQLLKAESKYIKRLAKDPDEIKLGQDLQKASDKLVSKWDQMIGLGCSSAQDRDDVGQMVDDLRAELVLQTIVSPGVDDTQFTTISPTGTVEYERRSYTPACVLDTPYHYFVKRGSVNNLLMYYQGGGACWENLTCGFGVCDQDVDPNSWDNPEFSSSGFADLSNSTNPFKDWNIVFVSYCTCDVHFGDANQTYVGVLPDFHAQHYGYHNARVVEKWAREHFVNPDVIFVTGSSAGAYGAVFNAPLHHDVWPASEFNVLGDAGNGVITPSFLQNEFENWNFRANLPSHIPGVVESIDDGTGMVAYVEAVANFFTYTNWGHYTSAYDGGSGGQTGFYNVMLNGNNPLAATTWWEGSCAFNTVMRQQAQDTIPLTPGNYRYYIGSGSRHTMWGSDKVYSDTLGGVPTIVSWINGMLGDPNSAWDNIEASPFNVLLPGDPRPDPLVAPFEPNGPDTIVNCP